MPERRASCAPSGVGVEVSTRGIRWSARGEDDENQGANGATLVGVYG